MTKTEFCIIQDYKNNLDISVNDLCRKYDYTRYAVIKLLTSQNLSIKKSKKGRPRYGDSFILDYINSHPGCCYIDIINETGLSRTKVKKVVKENNLVNSVKQKTRKGSYSSRTNEILLYISDNLDKSYADIAKHFGTSRSYISQLARKVK